MIYMHVLNRGGKGVYIPLDELEAALHNLYKPEALETARGSMLWDLKDLDL